MVGSAVAVLLLLLPLGGGGAGLGTAAGWMLAVPIGAVLRGMLIGVAILGAVLAARLMLGIGSADD